MKIEDKTMQALAASINFRQMRQELITSNIANAETPGYKAKRIGFEEALSRALDVDGNESLNWCHNISKVSDIDNFINLSNNERKSIYQNQLQTVLNGKKSLFL